MHEIAASEFPFVDALPRREKAAVKTAVDVLNDWREATRLHGSLVPTSMVAAVLNVSKQRVHQLIQHGRLVTVVFGGHNYVTELSLNDLASSERKSGRPFKVAGTFKKSLAVADYLAEETSK